MTGYEGLRSAAAWFELPGRGIIRVLGEDRARLLHAMSTNDVKNLPDGKGVYAFFLNDKGRIQADARIYSLGDTIWLDTEPEGAATLRDHLDRFIIADDVTLEDESETFAAIALEGPSALEQAAALGVPVPLEQFAVLPWKNGFVVRDSLAAVDGLRLFLPVAEQSELLQLLENVSKADPDEVRSVRLENGKPRFGEDLTDRFLASETQIPNAVHANKGCYLGQEIVERVRSRGQVHRLLASVRVAGKVAPPRGTKLLANGTPVAEITSATYSPALDEIVALAYVRTEALRDKPQLQVAESDPPLSARIP